jgi:hypothetical protein
LYSCTPCFNPLQKGVGFWGIVGAFLKPREAPDLV